MRGGPWNELSPGLPLCDLQAGHGDYVPCALESVYHPDAGLQHPVGDLYPELTSVAYNITAYYYRHFEVFLFISGVYLAFSLLFSLVFKYIEVRFLWDEGPRTPAAILTNILADTLVEKAHI